MNVFINFESYTTLDLFSAGKTNQYQRKTKFQLKLVKWFKKNAKLIPAVTWAKLMKK